MSWPKGKPRGRMATIPVGTEFNRLTVVGRNEEKTNRVHWDCICQCGKPVVVAACDAISGHTKSCGCFDYERKKTETVKHGYNRTPTYVVWSNMHARCSNPNRPDWKNYGGRGISVCDRWESFTNFLEDMGEKPKHLSIDRIDNNGNYEPKNCQWATASQQRNNQRSKQVRAAAAIGGSS